MESVREAAKTVLRASVAALHLTLSGLRGTVFGRLTGDGSQMAGQNMFRERFLTRAFLSKFLLTVALVVASLGMTASATVQAASALEKNFWLEGPRYDADVPPCEALLGEVTNRFAEKERQFWNSNLQITGFADVREIALQPWTSSTIPRRFCTAKALVSDGKPRTVHFSVIEDGGFASIGAGVSFCVLGLDRNWAYNPSCRAARP